MGGAMEGGCCLADEECNVGYRLLQENETREVAIRMDSLVLHEEGQSTGEERSILADRKEES